MKSSSVEEHTTTIVSAITDKQTVLGISPGTRVTGIAVFHDGELMEWKVKTINGAWSKLKLSLLTSYIGKTIDRYAARSMVVKILHESKSSSGLNMLIASLNLLAKEKRCLYYTCTIKDLKSLYKTYTVKNKDDLVEAICRKHPELIFVRNKEKKNRYRYYTKMFEAIACAHSCLKQQP